MRWSLTRHVLAVFSSKITTRSGCINDTSFEHDEVKPTALIRHEEHVGIICKYCLYLSFVYLTLSNNYFILFLFRKISKEDSI